MKTSHTSTDIHSTRQKVRAAVLEKLGCSVSTYGLKIIFGVQTPCMRAYSVGRSHVPASIIDYFVQSKPPLAMVLVQVVEADPSSAFQNEFEDQLAVTGTHSQSVECAGSRHVITGAIRRWSMHARVTSSEPHVCIHHSWVTALSCRC